MKEEKVMKEEKHWEEKIDHSLEAMEHPEAFSEEELHALLADEESLQACHDLLDAKEALARTYAPAPNVEEEWNKFLAHYPETNTPTPGRTRRLLPVSLVLLAAACIGLFFLLHTSVPTGYTVFKATPTTQEITMTAEGKNNILTVPRGMNKKIMLTDGTRVWLNAESQLTYPGTFEGQERRVVRLKGEAYFEVAKDAAHPFIVKTDLLETQVIGTAFNIRAYSPEDARVTLLEGSVKVSDARFKKELLLTPGQNATLQKRGTFSVNEVQAKDYNAWAEGMFYFDNTALVEIMRELGRWYNINIIFTSKEAMHYRMHFQAERKDSLPQVLDLLNSMQKVNAKLEKDKVIVNL